jgi:hypothetical protein
LFTTTVALGRPLLFSEGHPTGGLSEAADPADQSYYTWERADLHRLIADVDVWTDVRLVHVLGDDSGPGRLLLGRHRRGRPGRDGRRRRYRPVEAARNGMSVTAGTQD